MGHEESEILEALADFRKSFDAMVTDYELIIRKQAKRIEMLRIQRRSNAYDLFCDQKSIDTDRAGLEQLEKWHDEEIEKAVGEVK